jgi:hypothetical protein
MHELATILLLLLRLLWRWRLCVCVCFTTVLLWLQREREERGKRGERGSGGGGGGGGGLRHRGSSEGTPFMPFFSSPPEYVCVHVHTRIQCIHANNNVYVYTYIHRDIYTHKCNMIFVCVYTYVCEHLHTQI